MREDWIDRWRGLMICVIVLFHVIDVVAPFADEAEAMILRHASAFIERFHVVSFFVLAGVIFGGGKPLMSFLFGKAKRLLIPYFSFGMMWALLYVLLSRFVSGGQDHQIGFVKPFVSVVLCNGWPDGVGRRVVSVLWFLPCMFIAEALYWLVLRLVSNATQQLLLLPFCYAATICLHGVNCFWEAQLVPKFVAFMILGRCLISIREIHFKHDRVTKIVCGVLVLAFVWEQNLLRLSCTILGLLDWIGFVNGFFGAFGCALIAQGANVAVLGTVGRCSLGILVIHKLWILAAQVLGVETVAKDHPFTICIGLACLACLASMAAISGIRRIAPWSLGERLGDVRNR